MINSFTFPRVVGADTTLRILLVLGGVAFIALGILGLVVTVEGANGWTRLLGVIGYVWELTYIAATVPILTAMAIICRVTRSVAAWVFTGLSALSLGSAAVIAVLRLAGEVDVMLPLANWVPGTIFIAVWAWVASRSAARAGRVDPGTRRAAGGLAIAQVTVVVVAVVAVFATGTRIPAVNLAAGIVINAIVIGIGLWWLTLAFRWHVALGEPSR